MKDLRFKFFRLIIFLGLISLIIYEYMTYMSLVDYMGQYNVGYDSEYYLYMIIGLLVVSILLTYLFVKVQIENSISELIYLYIMALFFTTLTSTTMLSGIWLFNDYKYDEIIYWGTAVINIYNIFIICKQLKRNHKSRHFGDGKNFT